VGVAFRVRGVSVDLGGTRVVDDVSLDVMHGRVLALVGPNGAGKSTLLSVLSGDRAPSAGHVELDGRGIGEWSPGELARRRAVLTQENQVAFAFTVREVVAMGRTPWRGTEDYAFDDAAVAEALAQADVAHLTRRAFPSLSGGEKARVSLARVLAQRTPTVLLDEPTAALDLRHQEDVMRIARELAATGVAVIVVLHDLSLAAAYADDLALLDRGTLAAHGSPADVLTPERVEAVYGVAVRVIAAKGQAPVIVPKR
jgi:iron complex transport system ATP-binding protein